MSEIVLVHKDAGIATVTLNRPEHRNALSVELISRLRRVMNELDSDETVRAVVLTGADPAFCAGLDLKELGRDGGALRTPPPEIDPMSGAGGSRARLGILATTKVIIGAVNGACVTGGLELALNCDFLVASERARFADTHARVGVHPLWGLTVLLPQAVGIRRAREMTSTGNFVDARTALGWGLVNHVVAHEELLSVARWLATEVAASDHVALSAILETYRRAAEVPLAEAWAVETQAARTFGGGAVDPEEIERRRRGIVERGRSQL